MNFVFTLLILAICLNLGYSELKFVIEMYRHGARGPISKFWDGPEQKDMAGELTPSGMRQQYNLGKQLRQEYINEK